MGGLPKEEAIQVYLSISKDIDKAKKRIKAKQKNHQANVVKAYFSRLVQERIWNKIPEYLQPSLTESKVNKITVGRPRNANDDWAYEQVRILGRDKQAVYTEWLEKIGDRRTILNGPKR